MLYKTARALYFLDCFFTRGTSSLKSEQLKPNLVLLCRAGLKADAAALGPAPLGPRAMVFG